VEDYTLLLRAILSISLCYALKILIKDPKPSRKDVFLFIATILGGFITYLFLLVVYTWLTIAIFVLYLYKAKDYSILSALISVFFLFSVVLLVPQLVTFTAFGFVSRYDPAVLAFASVQGGLNLVMAALFAPLITRLNAILHENRNLQIATIFILFLFVFMIGFTPLLVLSFSGFSDFPMSTLVVLGTLALMFFLFIGIIISMLTTQQRRIAESQNEKVKNLLYYTNELEQQQTVIRRFKHDYTNILASIESYLIEKDYDGLQQYFYSKIKQTSAIVTSSNFALQSLSKIKITEIKSILSVKLIAAQNRNIDVAFEADEEIDHIPLADTVALVRMLGIILDNAIEAVEELGYGKIMLSCFKQNGNIVFIIYNTCHPDISPIHKLMEAGFSSKGKDRGLGLGILQELARSQPNISIDTTIEHDNFIQRLSIIN